MDFSQFLHRYVCIVPYKGKRIFGIVRCINSKVLCIETEYGDVAVRCNDINVISEEEAMKYLLKDEYDPHVCHCYC